MDGISEIQLGVIGEDVVATFEEDGAETKEAMTIDQIRMQLLNMAVENVNTQDAYTLRIAATVLSALEAEYINCFAEPE